MTFRPFGDNESNYHNQITVRATGGSATSHASCLSTLICGVLLAGGCAAGLPPPGPGHAAVAQQRWPGTTLADLRRGAETYARKCSSCHALYDPRTAYAAEWPVRVREMAPRAKLGDVETEDVVRYLVVLSQAH